MNGFALDIPHELVAEMTTLKKSCLVAARNYAKICLHGSSLLRNAKFSSGVPIAYCLPSVINGSKFAKISLRAGSHGGRSCSWVDSREGRHCWLAVHSVTDQLKTFLHVYFYALQ